MMNLNFITIEMIDIHAFFIQNFYFFHLHPKSNPKVVEEMNEVLVFWMNKGVSGFRVDAVVTLFEVAPDAKGNLPDEPKSGTCSDPNDHCYL